MPNYKASFIFNSGKQGWTETWYLTETERSAAKSKMNTLGLARMRLLAKSVFLEACRVSDVAIPFDSDYISFTPQQNNARQAAGARDLPAVAYLMRSDAGPLYHRNTYIRGLPDEWIGWTQAGAEQAFDPFFKTAFDIWNAALLAAGVQIQAISKADADVGKVDVTGASITGGTSIAYLAPGHTFADKDRIRVNKLSYTGTADPNRTGVADFVVAAGTFQFTNAVETGSTLTTTGLGVARRQRIIYVTITESYLLRPVSRDTGRAFFVPRGRRKATTR